MSHKKTGGAAHKTYLTRVLLHDNVSQKQLLDMRLSSIATQQRRSSRMWENHKKAFVGKQYRKHQKFRGLAVDADAVNLVPAELRREYSVVDSGLDRTVTPSSTQLPRLPILPAISDSKNIIERTQPANEEKPKNDGSRQKLKAEAVVLPPIEGDKTEGSAQEKPSGTKDERFLSLFESLSDNLFTAEHGKHPLTQ